MSGGSYDYFCFKIDGFAEDIQDKNMPHRMAFKELVRKVGKAAHAIEWVDSGDYGDGREIEAIEEALGFDAVFKAKLSAYEKMVKLTNDIDRQP